MSMWWSFICWLQGHRGARWRERAYCLVCNREWEHDDRPQGRRDYFVPMWDEQ